MFSILGKNCSKHHICHDFMLLTTALKQAGGHFKGSLSVACGDSVINVKSMHLALLSNSKASRLMKLHTHFHHDAQCPLLSTITGLTYFSCLTEQCLVSAFSWVS